MSAFTMNNRVSGTKVTRRMVSTYEYEITGEIYRIEDTKTYGSGFRVREFVMLDESFNPQPVVFKLLQDKVELLDDLKEGDMVKVTFQLQGRFGDGQWSGRIFTNLEALAVEVLEKGKEKELSVLDPDLDEDIQF
jgi:single-strand DNA-binding protein